MYYARYKDQNGKWVKVKGYTDKTMTMRLARKLEDQAHAIVVGDRDPQAEARRLERAKSATEHLELYKADLVSKGRHPRHIHVVIDHIKRCLDFTGATTVAVLTRPMLAAWQSHCLQVGYPNHRKPAGPNNPPVPDSRKTILHRMSAVRGWLRYLTAIGAIDRCVMEGWEMLATKGYETRRRRALSKAEAEALVEKCLDDHRREIYRFCLYTGLRRSEVASMTPASFDFTQKTITINAKHAKRKTDHQILPMHSKLVDPLKMLCEGLPADTPVFHVPSRTDVVSTLHDDCKAAGIDPKDLDFHALRHSFCSLLAEQGIRPEILMKLARHKDIATTMRFYVHFKPDDERAALERI
jgi:integrase